MAKLETRIRELETELGSVQARMINLKPSYVFYMWCMYFWFVSS